MNNYFVFTHINCDLDEDDDEPEENSAASQLAMVDQVGQVVVLLSCYTIFSPCSPQILEESNANDALAEERAAEIQKIVEDMQVSTVIDVRA